MQDQPTTTATVIMSGNNPVASMAPGLSIPPSYTSPIDNPVKNLNVEQETLPPQSTGASTQMQTASQVNFTGVVTSAGVTAGPGVSSGVGPGVSPGVGPGVGPGVSPGFGTGVNIGISGVAGIGTGAGTVAGGYTPISSVPHMFSNQPTVSFTSSK